jgi:hypothetical protein
MVAFMYPVYRYTESLDDIKTSDDAVILNPFDSEIPPWSERRAILLLRSWRLRVLLSVVFV